MRINYKKIIDKIEEISVIDSQPVDLMMVEKEDCPSCAIDPFTGASVSSHCPYCHGEGYIYTPKAITLIANVEYIEGLETEYDLRGKYQKGQVLLTINKKELIDKGIEPDAFLAVNPPADYVVVNKKKYSIVNVTPQMLHGILYEVLVELEIMEDQQ